MVQLTIITTLSDLGKQALLSFQEKSFPDSQVHGVNMGPTWALPDPDGPHVGPMNLAIRVTLYCRSTRYASGVDVAKMSVRVPDFGESLITHCAAERFYSTMDANMCVTVTPLSETFFTYCIFIWFFFGMDA